MHKGKPDYVRIAISQPGGGVAVMQFITLVKRNEDDPGTVREATPENIEAEIAKAGIPSTGWRIIQDTDIPQDRSFRSAWIDDGSAIGHDMGKAREIHMGRIRAARNAKLDLMDKFWTKAQMQKSQMDADKVAAEMQILRDIPQTFDLSGYETIEQLKEAWPEELK